MPLVRVHPGDHEHGVALLQQPLHHALLRVQVEDVVLVDPGRDDQQRLGIDLLGQRRVLDQLDQVVLEHHLARADRGVAPDLEGVHVGLPDQELALAALQVLQHHLQPAHQVLALLVQRRLQHLGVQREEVGRVHAPRRSSGCRTPPCAAPWGPSRRPSSPCPGSSRWSAGTTASGSRRPRSPTSPCG